MQLPLQITFKGIEPSASLEMHIREQARKLERFFDHITSCRVVVEAPHRHHHKGKLYRAVINLTVPGGEIVVNHNGEHNHTHEDVHIAIRDAFAAAARRLEAYAQRRRGEVKSHHIA
jgi:ribosomal subunit interface protein